MESSSSRRLPQLMLAYGLLSWQAQHATSFSVSHPQPTLSLFHHPPTSSDTQRASLLQPTGRRKLRSLFLLDHKKNPQNGGEASSSFGTNSQSRTPSLNYVANPTAWHEDLTHFNVTWEQVLLPPECELTDEFFDSDHNCNERSPCVIPTRPHDEITRTDQLVLGSSTLLFFSLMAALVAWSGDVRYYLAGGICAAISHVVPVPVDVVKTRKQVDPLLADSTFWQAIQQIYRDEGLSALMVGAGPTFLGYFVEGAVKFGAYEVLKPLVQKVIPGSQHLSFLISAAVSGLAASIMLCPMEALRIRLVAEPEYAELGGYKGGLTMFKKEGIGAFGKGMLAMIYKQVPYTMTKNVSFDLLTKMAYASLAASTLSATKSLKLLVPLFCAATASVLSCISSQPGDMLLSLVNAHGGNRKTHDVARDILHSERGVRGFFVGIKARFLHVGISVTLQLMIYDIIKRLVGIAATGTV